MTYKSKCWKCKKQINKINIHHVDGNHENNNFNNKVYLCKKCHDLVQGICDKCEKLKSCRMAIFKECWSFDDAFPPIYFKINSLPRESINCKSMVYLKDNQLYIICLLGKINNKFKYPCQFNNYGCAYEKFPKKLKEVFNINEYRSLLKSLENLKEMIQKKNH